jgi:enolase-phosphatase E1
MHKPKLILTDIEGTTTSIAFVHDVLFPYFLENISLLNNYLDLHEVITAFEQTKYISFQEGKIVKTNEEIIAQIEIWAKEDRKVTPLKILQGVLWKIAYQNGNVKGHVYKDVLPSLRKWKNEGIEIAIFSSGSIAAQRLLFGYSDEGNLNEYFAYNFDTVTGVKKEAKTYSKIAQLVKYNPDEILFLSDIVTELEAADEAGFKTIQLVREGTIASWNNTVTNFKEIQFIN